MCLNFLTRHTGTWEILSYIPFILCLMNNYTVFSIAQHKLFRYYLQADHV